MLGKKKKEGEDEHYYNTGGMELGLTYISVRINQVGERDVAEDIETCAENYQRNGQRNPVQTLRRKAVLYDQFGIREDFTVGNGSMGSRPPFLMLTKPTGRFHVRKKRRKEKQLTWVRQRPNMSKDNGVRTIQGKVSQKRISGS